MDIYKTKCLVHLKRVKFQGQPNYEACFCGKVFPLPLLYIPLARHTSNTNVNILIHDTVPNVTKEQSPPY